MLKMYIKRLHLHYIYTLVFPACALSILSILMFFIPIEGGERISFGVTIFLSFMVLMLQASDLLPANSKTMSAIGKYFLLLICCGLLTIFNSVVISFFQRNPALTKEKCNSISPVGSCNKDGVAKLDFVDQNQSDKRILVTDNKKSSKPSFLTWEKDSQLVHRTRQWMTPLRVFDYASFLACLTLSIYAHIELAIVTQANAC